MGKGEDTLNLGNTPPSSGHARQTFIQISYRQKIKLTKTNLGYSATIPFLLGWEGGGREGDRLTE